MTTSVHIDFVVAGGGDKPSWVLDACCVPRVGDYICLVNDEEWEHGWPFESYVHGIVVAVLWGMHSVVIDNKEKQYARAYFTSVREKIINRLAGLEAVE